MGFKKQNDNFFAIKFASPNRSLSDNPLQTIWKSMCPSKVMRIRPNSRASLARHFKRPKLAFLERTPPPPLLCYFNNFSTAS
jgi:hypothetical protein